MNSNWFVAWPVSGGDEWLRDLEASAPGGLDFTMPQDLHVTLAFLARYEPGMEGKMSALLRGLPILGLDARLDSAIALPQPRRFSALAFTIASGRKTIDQQITKWRDRICREAGARLETRPAVPHVTIARPDRRIGADDRAAALEWIASLPGGPAVHLDPPRIYVWNESKDESRYRILEP